ncbi:MAG: hypothetical protein V2I33_19645, partial [Kangiellaceae bacterium]|nr:hypothetical protein [Kangiellaceae bacterium]
QKDQTNCKKVRNFINENINWDVEIHYLYRDKNLGCGKAVSEAISWFFSHVEQGIILEDDCLPSPSFFKFCSQLLNRFKHDERIISINGFNFGMELENSNSYVFSKYMTIWGWATWRRSADRVDYEMQPWKKLKFKKLFLHKKMNNYFNLDYKWVLYWHKLFDNTSNGKINTWDYQWLFSQRQTNTYAIIPATNLIKNIGFGKDATHTKDSEHKLSKIEYKTIKFPLVHNTKISNSQLYEKQYLKKIGYNYTYEPILSLIFKIVLLKVKKIF